MALTVHYFSGSPFVWRVQLALEHKGIEHTMNALDPSKNEQRSEAFLTLNPHGKVPVIEHDGFALYEASAIVEYLEDRFADAPRLFPEDVHARARVRRLICEADTSYFPMSWAMQKNLYFKPKEEWDQEEIARGAEGVAQELERIEGELQEGAFHGDQLGAADHAQYPMIAHIARLEIRKPELALSDRIGPKTRAWMQRIEALPYFDRTYPPHWRK